MGQAWVSVKGASFQKFQETACRDLTALNENPGCGAERQTPLCRGAALYATRPSRGLRESRSLSASSLMEMVQGARHTLPHNPPRELRGMRKLKLREGEENARSHTTPMLQGWDSNVNGHSCLGRASRGPHGRGMYRVRDP